MLPGHVSFAVIVTTHCRPILVQRAIRSVLDQSYVDWRLVLVNDSPREDYTKVRSLIASEKRITYLSNETNVGKNASVNRAFEELCDQGFDGYIIFLDDDDWLASNCLMDFSEAIKKEKDFVWFVSERALGDDVSLTKNRTGRNIVHYYWNCLLTKRFSGDATHCVRFKEASTCHFLDTIKNAEEWFFFSQVALHAPRFLYLPSIGTYSEGYLEGGLSRTALSNGEKLRRYTFILRELVQKRALNIYTGTYMILRLGKILTYGITGERLRS